MLQKLSLMYGMHHPSKIYWQDPSQTQHVYSKSYNILQQTTLIISDALNANFEREYYLKLNIMSNCPLPSDENCNLVL
jgi:hypothetical protein